ncbi:MAG: response regulator [Proteobacteria bacterium]|nr:response regulator [Pseudomonadota bacterium]
MTDGDSQYNRSISGATILVVDDTEANVDLLVETLGDDYEVAVAMDGESALEYVAEGPPDLILLDVMMPGMDGYEVCRRLKDSEGTRDIPVIFVTAKTEVEDETRGFDLGAVDYITKPISPPVVRARVRTHLSLMMARQELAWQNEELREAARLRDDVDNIMRHDLKAPLNRIIGLPQLVLKDGALPPEHAAVIRQIEESGYQMLKMINLSLDLFKMERGTYRFDAVAVDLPRVVHRVAADNQGLAKVRDIALESRLEGRPIGPGESFFVQGEELLCYSMLGNLVKNAVEAAPSGSAVTVDILSGERPGLWVRNPGVVPEGIRETFFDKYVTAGKSGGTGLGTYSARLMAETQGGDIRLETSEENGTAITVRFRPASEAMIRTARKRPEAETDVEDLPDPSTFPSLHLLLVDDDEINLAILRRFLDYPAFAIDEAAHGREALERYTAEPFDLVIMDVEMPVMDGFQAAAAIRKWEAGNGRPAVPILALTAHEEEAFRSRGREAGFSGHLTKPIRKPALIRALLGFAPNPAGRETEPEPELAAVDRVTVDPDLEELIPGFLAKRRQEADEMGRALETGDLERLRQLGHSLKGSSRMYGFSRMGDLGQAVEEAARADDPAAARENVKALTDYLKRVEVVYK